jgi:ATP-dependent RNA helicase SUPV3L1/SUV3
MPLTGVGHGLAFQLVDALGCLPAAAAAEQVQALDNASRRALGRAGVRFGGESLYLEPLLGADSSRFRALLWAVQQGRALPPLPGTRALGKAIAVDPALPASFYAAIGRRVIGTLALRPDRLERLSAAARLRTRNGPFAADAELAGLAGVAIADLRSVLTALGYRAATRDGNEVFVTRPRRFRRLRPHPGRRLAPAEGNPFAKLTQLKFA